jgi:ribose transport system ATP-binding protein
MCDRVIVMRNGRKMTEVLRDSKHFNQESIMKAAWGGDINEVSAN